MRLIDADGFKKQTTAIAVKYGCPAAMANALCELVDHQATAYDLDGALEQMEELSNEQWNWTADNPGKRKEDYLK